MRSRIGVLVGLAVLGGLPVSAYAQNTETGARRTSDTPRANEPVMPRLPEPVFTAEAGAGVLGFVAGAASVGPAWNVRITANLTNRFALEGNYVGSVNQRTETDNALVMSAVDADLRYNILRGYEAPVQPFVTAGFGYAAFGGSNGDLGTVTLPVGVGVERLLTPGIKVGGRIAYRPALFDHLGEDDQATEDQPGADTWTVLAHLGGAF
jgi:hypothetical protein